MTVKIEPKDIDKAIAQALKDYSDEVVSRVNEAGRESMDKLVKITRSTAPRGVRRRYWKSIASKEITNATGVKKFVWYVKAPEYRLTHLLVHGHATPTGDRTEANPFLQNALDQVLPEYEKAIREAITGD